jgi:hypothetical protein
MNVTSQETKSPINITKIFRISLYFYAYFELFPEFFQVNCLKRSFILHLFGTKENLKNKFCVSMAKSNSKSFEFFCYISFLVVRISGIVIPKSLIHLKLIKWQEFFSSQTEVIFLSQGF